MWSVPRCGHCLVNWRHDRTWMPERRWSHSRMAHVGRIHQNLGGVVLLMRLTKRWMLAMGAAVLGR